MKCGVPVIPVGVIGTVEVQPVNSNFMRPFKTVRIRFGVPMQMDPPENPDDPLDHDHTRCRAFTDELMKEIARLSERSTSTSMCPHAQAPRHPDRTRSPGDSSPVRNRQFTLTA